MLKKILTQNWLPLETAAESESSCPESVFFLEEDFIRHYYPIARLPEDKLGLVISKAQVFNRDDGFRCLAWHMYRCFTKGHVHKFSPFPEFIVPLGYDTGILNILLLLSLVPEYEERARRENFPLRYAHGAASRIGGLPTFFAQVFEGRFGIRSRSLHFMLYFKDLPMYRIGRFDFCLDKCGPRFPRVYVRGDEVAVLCDSGWRMDKNGERLFPFDVPQKDEWLTGYSDDGVIARGNPVDIKKGFAVHKEIELSRTEWRYAAGPEDYALHVHIPGGGRMLPELCRSSCKEALAFFAEKYPDKPVKTIFTISWIANEAWLDYLPDSNISALIRTSALFPSPHNGNAGLYFVFGREDPDYSSYPRNNSLEKAMLQCVEDGRPLRSPGMIFLPLPE